MVLDENGFGMKVVLDETGFGMKVVLDENFWDEKRRPIWMKRRSMPSDSGTGAIVVSATVVWNGCDLH